MIQPTPQGPLRDDDHGWVHRRLAAAAAGLLTDGDEEQFRSHLASCSACAEIFAEQVQALADEGPAEGQASSRHLAPAMIARWDRAAQDLRGLERELVQQHLASCADCRADLAALGHRPELFTAAVAQPAQLPRRSFRAGLSWGVGVTALAAVVAGLVFMPVQSTRENAVLPWVAPVTLRGGSPAALDLPADASRFAILAALPGDFDARRPATVTVLDPAGGTLLSTDMSTQMQMGRTISIVVGERGDITSGDYRVVFTQAAEDGSEVRRESTFRVNRQER